MATKLTLVSKTNYKNIDPDSEDTEKSSYRVLSGKRYNKLVL